MLLTVAQLTVVTEDLRQIQIKGHIKDRKISFKNDFISGESTKLLVLF